MDDGLTDRQRKYAEGIAAGKDSISAALAAGYGKSYAAVASSRVGSIPAVAKAIEEIRQKGREMAVFGLVEAMKAAEGAASFARANKNSMALVKAIELQCKLAGLLVEQIHVKAEVIDLKGALLEAQTRVLNAPMAQLPAPIGAQPIVQLSPRYADLFAD